MLFLQLISHKTVVLAKLLPLRKIRLVVSTVLLTVGVVHNAFAAAVVGPSQDPLFLSNPVTPIMMLNMSKDHQLYYKVYDDYSDIDNLEDGDGQRHAETTYKNSYDYYGYFNSKICYSYNITENRFEPSSKQVDNYCNASGATDQWSGNFLNWASMTRMDAVRKILYGGLRSTDSATTTVLERAFLPHDAHSFAKFYDGVDLAKLTPFKDAPVNVPNTSESGITICNTTPGGSALSQNVTSAPLLRVALGNYTFWASNERWQCRWGGNDSNGNNSDVTHVYAESKSPDDSKKLGKGSAEGDYYARVQVCVGGYEEDNCYQYPNKNKKPQGLLQEFGEIRDGSSVAKINFGLMTGSYVSNKAGGILRKVVGNLNNEVNATTDGTFQKDKNGVLVDGAIKTLNKLRIYGYKYSDGTYFGGSGSDDCSWALGSFSSGCSNWGNPQAEIYLESLRYLAGKAANKDFSASDSSKIADLPSPAWTVKPVTADNFCAPLNVLQFNTSSTSYDGDNLADVSDIMGTESLNKWTDNIGGKDYENLEGDYFVGSTATQLNQLCTAKAIGNLSDVRGTCPDAPRLEGSYQIAGLASYVRQHDLIPASGDKRNSKEVRTYGVALAPALPKVIVDVPGSTTKKTVTILPACRNKTISTKAPDGSTGEGANCAIVDFKILTQSTDNSGKNTGTLYVNWEDSEQGGDYDQDMWGLIKYEITASKVKITTDVIAQSTGDKMGFGFIVNGTDHDGFHVVSGINQFTDDACSQCTTDDSEKSVTYDVGTSSAKLLEPPLYYAAKWGGYSDDFVKKLKEATEKVREGSYSDATLRTALNAIKKPSTYHFATDPRALEDSLRNAFRDVAAGIGSASAVATNSTRLSEGTYVYQARFNSENWSGTLNAYAFDKDGKLSSSPISSDDTMPKTGLGRKVYTYNGSSIVDFSWSNLTTGSGTSQQQEKLQLTTETTAAMAEKRANWLLGNTTDEGAGGLRDRGDGAKRNILGDIVNSSPAYVGATDFRYQNIPGGGSKYRAYLTEKKGKVARLFVGANDGMVHAFQAPTDTDKTLKELYAYIPSIAFPKLAKLTLPNYGSKENPHQFTVDGPITVSDVYLGSGSSAAWHTIIVGTLGAGGRGIYALDVTNPEPKVLFELSDADYPELGYVMGKPLIVPMKNGRWVAIFGNGSASTNNSSLFVVDILNPKKADGYTRVIDTGTGAGLSAPALLPNAIGQVETAYAGDLSGNLWRFDLSDTDQNNWKKDYLLFTAKDSSNVIQPISAAPTLGINTAKDYKIMVYFGTGKYFDTGDNSTATSSAHSFYAIADIGGVVSRSSLARKTFTTTGIKPNQVRTQPSEKPDWTVDNGWYLDFTSGERVTTRAILLQDKLVFPTLIPSGSSCEYGGASWLMEVPAVGNKFTNTHILDNNLFNQFLVLGDIGFGQLGELGKGAIVGSGTDATLLNVKANYDKSSEGRQSWRQLR